jgi:hypothetical protein
MMVYNSHEDEGKRKEEHGSAHGRRMGERMVRIPLEKT